MNWVGGSRSRYMMRCDTKKQREFFEKRKLKRRLQTMGLPVPTPPKGSASGSMDLVTLFIVNQIAAKKEIKDKPNVTVLGDRKGISKTLKNRPLELPMSPGSPSQLCLSESQPYYSVQRVNKRKYSIQDGFKCQQLSTVLESTFSDHSSSEPLHHHLLPHNLSPFPSSSSGSSRQVFSGQPDIQHGNLSHLHPCSQSMPPFQFHPFSQPRTREVTQWSSAPNTPRYLPDTPTVARALFRSPPSQDGQARDQDAFCSFSISQSDDRQPPLSFTLNQSETAETFEEGLFSGLDGEATHFLKSRSKRNLIEETPISVSRLQSPRDPPTGDCTDTKRTQDTRCTNMGSPCVECRSAHSAPDSESDDCQLCLLSGSSSSSDGVGVDTLTKSSQWSPPGLAQPPAAHTQPPGEEGRPAGRQPAPSAPLTQGGAVCGAGPPAQSPPPSRPPHTRDSATQTCDVAQCQTRDAWTQSEACAAWAWRHAALPPGGTGGQADPGDGSGPPALLSEGFQRGGDHGPWRRGSTEEGRGHYASPNATYYDTLHTEGMEDRQDRAQPPLTAPAMEDGQATKCPPACGPLPEDRGGLRGEGWRPDCVVEHAGLPQKEVTVGGVNSLSEEVETLQEIADILLMLRQRKRES